MQDEFNRRQLLHAVLCSVACSAWPRSSDAAAEKLSSADPKAVALHYVEDAAKLDAKQVAGYQKGQTCANCKLIQLRYGFLRPCELFPGKVVSAKGWCSAWAARSYGS